MSLSIVTRVLFEDVPSNLKLYSDKETVKVLQRMYGNNLSGNLAFYFKKYFLDNHINNTEDKSNKDFIYVSLLTNDKSLKGLDGDAPTRFILQTACIERAKLMNEKEHYKYHLLQPLINCCNPKDRGNYNGELAELLNEAMKPIIKSEIRILEENLNPWFAKRLFCFRN